MPIEIIQFHNKPILRIQSDTKQYLKLQIGINKAQLIIENIEAIKDFIENNNTDKLIETKPEGQKS